MAVLQILADHGHEHNLNHVGDKQPEHERRERVEAQAHGRERVPTEPADRPTEDHEEKAHRADVVGDPQGESFKPTQALRVFAIDVVDWLSQFFEFVELRWRGRKSNELLFS